MTRDTSSGAALQPPSGLLGLRARGSENPIRFGVMTLESTTPDSLPSPGSFTFEATSGDEVAAAEL